MPITERTHAVSVEQDGLVDLADIEDAALDFARHAPAELVGAAVEMLADELLDTVVGPCGLPLRLQDQPEAPWSCTACSSSRGFRRRGQRRGGRKLNSAVGQVHFALAQLECLRCGRRFAPMLQVLGLRAHQRRTDRLGDLAASLAVEVAYAKAARLVSELAGVALERPLPPSPRDLHRSRAPPPRGRRRAHRVVGRDRGAGRRRQAGRRSAAGHRPGGPPSRSRPAGGRGPLVWAPPWARGGTPCRPLGARAARPGHRRRRRGADRHGDRTVASAALQRCLFHLSKATQHLARYTDRLPLRAAKAVRARFDRMLLDAYRSGHAAATGVSPTDAFIAYLDHLGAAAAAEQQRFARPHALTFLTRPEAGRLVLGDKRRAELGTGVLERKYRHGQWVRTPVPIGEPPARFRLTA